MRSESGFVVELEVVMAMYLGIQKVKRTVALKENKLWADSTVSM